MIRHADLKPYVEQYSSLQTEPLRITMIPWPGSRLIRYDQPTIDGVLSWAVVHEATKGRGLADTSVPYLLPVPLRCLWTSSDGLPLWAATPLKPFGGIEDSVWETKRSQPGHFTLTKSGRFRLTPQAGRWRERLTPRPSVVAPEWVGYCEGNAEEIERLLATVRAVGKRRGAGYGEVFEWRIEAVAEFELLNTNGRLVRNLPMGAVGLLSSVPVTQETLIAWTPPYWRGSAYLPGWPTRTEVDNNDH